MPILPVEVALLELTSNIWSRTVFMKHVSAEALARPSRFSQELTHEQKYMI